MITVKTAISIHDRLIEEFGGRKGVRDIGGLEAALARPYATFDGIELNPHPTDKAAALLESLAINHPFVDGNKRIAYTLTRLLLLNTGNDIDASQDEKYDLVIKVSTGEFKIDGNREWLKLHLK